MLHSPHTFYIVSADEEEKRWPTKSGCCGHTSFTNSALKTHYKHAYVYQPLKGGCGKRPAAGLCQFRGCSNSKSQSLLELSNAYPAFYLDVHQRTKINPNIHQSAMGSRWTR